MSNQKTSIFQEGLSLSMIGMHFPFHFILNRNLEFVATGKGLQKIRQEFKAQNSFLDLFRLKNGKKEIETVFEKVQKGIGQPITLQFNNIDEVQLKGEFYLLPDSLYEEIIFLGTLWVNSVKQLEALGLELS
ncbi:MAG: hypothetical protein RLZZ595_958, partial [Bacteroidota bacterium]